MKCNRIRGMVRASESPYSAALHMGYGCCFRCPRTFMSAKSASGKVVWAGKHGVVVDANGAKQKLFWDEVESVKKPGKHGESTGAGKPPWKPLEPGMVDPAKALEAAGWKATAKDITTNSYEH